MEKESRTLGTIYNKNGYFSGIIYPVFPSSFLRRIEPYMNLDNSEDSIYADIYTTERYGKWGLNTYKFNVDKTHLKMIDSSGSISNMYIPKAVNLTDVLDVGIGDDKYNRKVYFTTQGAIVSDSACVPPLDNMNKMTLNECNAIDKTTTVRANDDDQLALNLNESANYNNSSFITRRKKKTFSKRNNLILKERDEPWFTDSEIVGTIASITHPHKVTGIDDGRSVIPLLGTDDDDIKELNAPYTSGCLVSEPTTGYSRYEKDKNCKGDKQENFDNKYEDTHDNKNMDYTNNVIIFTICGVIILLLLYRRVI